MRLESEQPTSRGSDPSRPQYQQIGQKVPGFSSSGTQDGRDQVHLRNKEIKSTWGIQLVIEGYLPPRSRIMPRMIRPVIVRTLMELQEGFHVNLNVGVTLGSLRKDEFGLSVSTFRLSSARKTYDRGFEMHYQHPTC